jgi:hypothetical protein
VTRSVPAVASRQTLAEPSPIVVSAVACMACRRIAFCLSPGATPPTQFAPVDQRPLAALVIARIEAVSVKLAGSVKLALFVVLIVREPLTEDVTVNVWGDDEPLKTRLVGEMISPAPVLCGVTVAVIGPPVGVTVKFADASPTFAVDGPESEYPVAPAEKIEYGLLARLLASVAVAA